MEPFITSDGLELFFTRADLTNVASELYVMIAKRTSTAEPFSNAQVISAIEGDAIEAPSITYSGDILYFHKKVNGMYSIYSVRR